jgi:FlaG/FlaF family flagellin (archaellin)
MFSSFYLNMFHKRSVSPLIATILLIVVSVILVTVVLTWGSDFAKDKLSTTQSPAYRTQILLD